MLLKRDPANPAPAEEAFQTAIAVAKQQGTRSFELRAALRSPSSTNRPARPADAHAVLAPALEGFSPSPLSRAGEGSGLRASGTVVSSGRTLIPGAFSRREKGALTPKCPRSPRRRSCWRSLRRRMRSRRTRRDVNSGAIARRLWQRPDRRARARRAGNDRSFRQGPRASWRDKDAPERLAADYGLYVGSPIRDELSSMRAHAAAFLADVEARPDLARSRRRASRPGHHPLVRRRISSKRGSISNVRSPCSNPAATTTCPSGSDRTPAPRRWSTLALAPGLLAKSRGAISLVERMRERTAVLRTPTRSHSPQRTRHSSP